MQSFSYVAMKSLGIQCGGVRTFLVQWSAVYGLKRLKLDRVEVLTRRFLSANHTTVGGHMALYGMSLPHNLAFEYPMIDYYFYSWISHSWESFHFLGLTSSLPPSTS